MADQAMLQEVRSSIVSSVVSKCVDWLIEHSFVRWAGGLLLSQLTFILSWFEAQPWSFQIGTALMGLAFLFAFAILLVLARSIGPAKARQNLEGWDKVDPLTTEEAAYLWVGLEPRQALIGGGTDESHRIFRTLKRAIDQGSLPSQSSRRPANRWMTVSRNDLARFAVNSMQEHPAFLFSDRR